VYKNFFGLNENPFNAKPDLRFFFVTKHAREALSCLAHSVLNRKGFVLLTGEAGTGKTTLLNVLVKWLRLRRTPTAILSNPRLSVSGFFEDVVLGFGIDYHSTDKSHLLQQLNRWLLDRGRLGETAVLIIDEAQDLSNELLEEIRLLTNLDTKSENVLQIVFAGQLELEKRLKQQHLRQLGQRIALRCRTHRLEPAEIRDYILRRLHVAGANGMPIFTAEALEAAHRYGGGIQRLTNLLCEHALISAFADQKKLIAEDIIEEIAHEVESDESVAAQYVSGEKVKLGEVVKLVTERREPSQVARPNAATASRATTTDGGSEAKQVRNWINDALQRAERANLAASTNTRVNQAQTVEESEDAEDPITAPTFETSTVDALLASIQQPAVSSATDVREQIEEVAPSPWSPDLHRLLFSSTNGRKTVGESVGEEEFRTLRSRLYRIREKRPLKTVLVGSAVAGEGKTFVTGNLGLVLASQRNRRVLVIDCDLRKPELHTWFGASCKPGITEYLRSTADEAAILQRSPKENLYFIPAGERASNPAELLGNGRLRTLLERIGQSFDWIVFDAPPILPVADASQIATLCDGVLLVVLAGSTASELAERARHEFRHTLPVIGVVLNQVSKNQTHAWYGYNYALPEAKAK
jgi:general secretion pathway protein A